MNFLLNHGFRDFDFLANFSIQKFNPCFLFLAGISPWGLWIRIKRKKLICKAARIAPQTKISPYWVQTHRFFFVLSHGFRNFYFFEILVHRDARARAPARVVPNHGVLVHRGARARARPRESSLTMHGVLVHRGARPRARAPARVVPNHGARRLY